jgi:hypothetical protein
MGSEGEGNGKFSESEGIDIDFAHMYVADIGNNCVQVFALEGTPTITIPS